MKLIKDEAIREIILSVWKNTLEKSGQKIDINDAYIDELERSIYVFQDSSKQESKEYFGKHISLTYTGILCMGILSLEMDTEDESSLIEWKFEGKGNPNLALRSLLINITNNYLAVIRLIEEGMDFQARILLSNICELTWLTLVLISRKDLMELYTKIEIGNAKEKWNNNFRVENLMKELTAIETEIGKPELLPAAFEELRSEIHDFYSLNIHNSYYWCVKGSFSRSIKEDDSLVPNTFGMASKDSVRTLEILNKSFCYFLYIFVLIMEKKHGFKPSSEEQLWVVFDILRYSFLQSSVEIFEEEVINGE